MLSGSSFQRRGAYAQNAQSPNLFRCVCGICNTFLKFDIRVLVLACLTNSSLKYRGTQTYILNISLWPLCSSEHNQILDVSTNPKKLLPYTSNHLITARLDALLIRIHPPGIEANQTRLETCA